MNEQEKRLRSLLATDAPRSNVEAALDALLVAHRAASEELNRAFTQTLAAKTAQARADALEEAARTCDKRAADLDNRTWPGEDSITVTKYELRVTMVQDRQGMAKDIRALSATPPASIPVAKVRDAVTMRLAQAAPMTDPHLMRLIRAEFVGLSRDLGVPLDGGESRALKCPGCPCSVHEKGDCRHRCEDV